MGFETELKYAVAAPFSKDELFSYPPVSENRGEIRTLTMRTEYLDTEDDLAKRLGITLRRREENGKSVFCVKVNKKRSGALSLRGEWNAECDDIKEALTLLSKQGAPTELFLKEELVCVARVSFTRWECEVTLPEMKFILSYDEGILGRDTAFSEIEIELVSGDVEKLLKFGEELKEHFPLREEALSKYARALLYK
ncbi:MAG: CYTH domain-containing protein [Oscillospiraceae bacterium]|nr:CYTH domain-containing protein [Oscillospiraceae bacterium]